MRGNGWISVEHRLPLSNTLVWLWDGGDWVALGSIYAYANEANEWCWTTAEGELYVYEGEITAECYRDDLDVKYWQPVPKLSLDTKNLDTP
jgi:hypothetical protein